MIEATSQYFSVAKYILMSEEKSRQRRAKHSTSAWSMDAPGSANAGQMVAEWYSAASYLTP